jgi:hypothetical protein
MFNDSDREVNFTRVVCRTVGSRGGGGNKGRGGVLHTKDWDSESQSLTPSTSGPRTCLSSESRRVWRRRTQGHARLASLPHLFSDGDTIGFLPCGHKLRANFAVHDGEGVSDSPTVPSALYARNTTSHALHRLCPLLRNHHTLEARVPAYQQGLHSLMQPPTLAWPRLVSTLDRRTQFPCLNTHHNKAA